MLRYICQCLRAWQLLPGQDHDLWQPEQDLDLHAALILCPAAALKRSTHSPLTFVTTFFNVHPVRWQLTLMLHEGHAWEEKLTVFYISEFPGLLATTLEPFHDLGRKTLAWQNVKQAFFTYLASFSGFGLLNHIFLLVLFALCLKYSSVRPDTCHKVCLAVQSHQTLKVPLSLDPVCR